MERSETIGLFLALFISIVFLGSYIGPIAPISFSLALGSSMFPTISNGDMLVCVSKYLSPIKPGDIAVYKKGGEYIVHRVLYINGSYVVFKGDNNMVPDEKVPASNVYFKVVAILPPYIWVPLFSIGLSLYGVGLILGRKRGKTAKEIEVYSVSTILYFTSISAIVILLAVNSLSATPLYLVKPNPLPKITEFSFDANTLQIHFDNPIRGNITCSGVIDGKAVPLSCARSGSQVVIDVSPLKERCNGLCPVQIVVTYKVDSPYNVVVKYPIATTVAGER